jgi:hypothetical protein
MLRKATLKRTLNLTKGPKPLKPRTEEAISSPIFLLGSSSLFSNPLHNHFQKKKKIPFTTIHGGAEPIDGYRIASAI